MFKKIIAGVLIVLGLFAGLVALQPSDYKVSRSATIASSPANLYPRLSDLHEFQKWSPWAKLDPDAHYVYSGPPAGTGAAYTWTGNSKVGEGRMTVTAAEPAKLVRYQIDFLKPMAGTADAQLQLQAQGAGTQVTWEMTGKNNFLGKAFCLFVSMDKMIGGDFERGLAALKAQAEADERK